MVTAVSIFLYLPVTNANIENNWSTIFLFNFYFYSNTQYLSFTKLNYNENVTRMPVYSHPQIYTRADAHMEVI